MKRPVPCYDKATIYHRPNGDWCLVGWRDYKVKGRSTQAANYMAGLYAPNYPVPALKSYMDDASMWLFLSKDFPSDAIYY